MIAAMLRVKNEARWIARVIKSILPLCERVVIMDDHSDDGTPEICSSFERVIVVPSPFSGLDESRDKNWLLAHAMELRPKWILCIDGDEELEAGAADRIRTVLEHSKPCSYALRVAYLWDAPDQVRTDGVYGRFYRPSLFYASAGSHFCSTANGGNFHCGNVPWSGVPARILAATLLHYGYMERADRIRKYEWYNERDPGNRFEDCYRHIVQGDLPEVPATAKLRHGGPLRLEALECPPL